MSTNSDKYDVVTALTIATRAELESLIETQTLMQLLVKKGILTSEEIQHTRKFVQTKSPRIKKVAREFASFSALLNLFDKADQEKDRFMHLLVKMMTDRDSLTNEELTYLDSKLDFKKYSEDDSIND